MSAVTHGSIELAPVAVEGAPKLSSRVSWGAIFAGAFVAVVVGAMINLLGAGVGGLTIDVRGGSTPDLSTLTTAGAVWLIASTLVALAVGGFIAGRLSGTADSEDGLCHGLAVWAVAALLGAATIGSAVSTAVGSLVSGGGAALGGLATAAAPAVGAAADGSMQSLIDQISATLGAADVDTAPPDQLTRQLPTLVAARVTNGSWTPEEKDRVVAIVARVGGLTPDQARSRVDAMEQTIAEAEQKAKAAAEAAVEASTYAAFWAFGTLLIGALVASAAALGGVRNRYLLASARHF
jgi:hypothetical protein